MNFLDTALEYASREWPVFPLRGKEPLTSNGVKNATIDKTIIEEWAKRWPSANIGIACGKQSFIVLDFDKPDARETITAYVKEKGIESATEDLTTISVRTGKGYHLYFHWVEGCENLRNWASVVDGLDIRTEGGYVVAPPSVHPTTGKPYEWINSPDECELKPMPEWLLDFILESRKNQNFKKLENIERDSKLQRSRRNRDDYSAYAQRALEDEIAILRATHKGERNNQLNESAIKLFGLVKVGELDKAEVEGELRRAARSIGLDDDETEKTIRSAWNGADKRDLPDPSTKGVTPSPAKSPNEKGPSVATRLVNLVQGSGADLWHDPNGDEFVTIHNGGHLENYPLRSKQVKAWLGGLLYEAEGRAPHGTGIQDALTVLEGLATFEGEEFETYVRLAEHEGNIYLDLANDEWEAVEVTTQGWEVIPSTRVPVKFRRPKGLSPLPTPTSGGCLEDLLDVINVPKGDEWILVKGWLVQAFRPTGPYPPLIVLGEQGSAKSWLVRTLRSLIDPNVTPLRRPPKTERDLMIAAVNGWVVAYDNLSGLPPWLGDGICVLSTGGGLAQRELYTDSEEAMLDAQRPVVLNGIDEVTTRGDLLDRAIIIHLPRIKGKDRRTEANIKTELDEIRPGVIGAILDAVVCGLRELPNVRPHSLPRMADFAVWVSACEGALSCNSGAFLEAFNKNQTDANASLIDNDLFATNVVEFVNGGSGEFKEPASLLLTVLETRANINGNKPDGWPRSARGVTNKLKRFGPALRAVGIEVEFLPRTNSKRPIKISKIEGTQSTLDGGSGKGDTTGDGSDGTDLVPSPSKPTTGDGGGDGVTVVTVGSHLIKMRERKEREPPEWRGIVSFCGNKENTVTTVTPSPHEPPVSGLEGDGRVTQNRKGDATNNVSKIEMETPTKEGSSWRKLSGGKDLSRGLEKFDGRLTAEDMINSFGWKPSKVKFTFDLLESQYGWTRDKLVSGLVVFKPPVEAV